MELWLSFSAAAQCGPQATPINTSCGSYCYSVQIQMTGILEVDNNLMDGSNNTMYRKPTLREAGYMATQLEALCD